MIKVKLEFTETLKQVIIVMETKNKKGNLVQARMYIDYDIFLLKPIATTRQARFQQARYLRRFKEHTEMSLWKKFKKYLKERKKHA